VWDEQNAPASEGGRYKNWLERVSEGRVTFDSLTGIGFLVELLQASPRFFSPSAKLGLRTPQQGNAFDSRPVGRGKTA
jgi:hypothetical protein